MYEIFEELLNERGLTAYKFCKDTGVSSSTISTWKKKGSKCGTELAEIIANYFGVTIDYVLGKTVFKNSFELFEHWGLSSDGYFEAAFDFGKLLKNERKAQGISCEEVSEALGVTSSDVRDIEEGILPLNHDWAEKYANFLGTSVSQIFVDNDIYEGNIRDGYQDRIDDHEKIQIQIDNEAQNENQYGGFATLAAHFDGDEYTPEELEEIRQFAEFVKNKRK